MMHDHAPRNQTFRTTAWRKPRLPAGGRRLLLWTSTTLLLVTQFTLSASSQGAGDALMRLLRSGNLPEERYPAVIDMVARRGDEADLGFLFDRVTSDEGWKGDTALVALRGLVAAAENRRLKPEGELVRLTQLLGNDQPAEVRRLAIRLAGLWRVPELLGALQELATAADTAPETRSAALEALAAYGDDGRKTIESLAANGPLATRAPAIAALAGLDRSAAAKQAAAALAAAKPQDDPAPVLAALLERQGGPDALAQALAEVQLAPEVARAALSYMYSVGRSDGALSAALGQAAGIAMEDKPITPEEMTRLAALAMSQGDVERGELVFRRADLSCQKCHALAGAGGNIGPDLSAIGVSSPVDYLVSSILEPDAAIKEHYETQIVLTVDGLIITGVVADENDQRLILRTAEGVDRSIPKADIEEREKGNSLMPQGLVKFMTEQEFLDLTRFLAELGKPGTPYAVRPITTIQRWRVLNDPPEALLTTVPDEATFQEVVPPLDDPRWQPVYARVDGTLPLNELTRGSDQPIYLQAEIQVRAGGGVGLRFDSVAGLNIWINGDHIDVLSPSFATEFSEGRQSFLLRVDPAQRSEPTLRVELFKPEGSNAVAEPVGGV
jgi:putative heme-binding domain-containing protein